ncbi:MAG TPA: ATP-binding cassette domain-containing protein [Solirubrobacteraceae bacterium]|nr:ATP-binding cassette domain-containing protein [Solirubrobacteraceae bacterium]
MTIGNHDPVGLEGELAAEPLLTLDRVSRSFGDVHALADVSVEFLPGQIHAVVGANGSGKSTLVKLISGVHATSSGSMRWRGETCVFASPSDARRRGVRVVHQEAPLIDNLSVLEVVATFQGYGVGGFRPIPWRRLRKRVGALLDELDLHVGLDELCAKLGPADRAGIAIAIATQDTSEDGENAPAELLILDEVTAAIPEADAATHLRRVESLAASGLAVLMVTHRLAELEIARELTMLRAGQVVYRQGDHVRLPNTELVRMLVVPDEAIAAAAQRPDVAEEGPVTRLWGQAPPAREARGLDPGVAAIEAQDLHAGALAGFSISCMPGEIVGLVGLAEGGIADLPGVLMGTTAIESGQLLLGGRAMPRRSSPSEMQRAGLLSVPSDRLREGGVATLSVTENLILPAARQYWHRRELRQRVVRGVIDAFDVRPPRGDVLFGTLSGGNQQKVLLGKWLLLRPRVLVLDDPTHGVDPVARETIFEAIRDAAAHDVCVLFFTTEPEQLIRVCTRVLVLQDGAVSTDLRDESLTQESLMELSYT